MLAHMQRHARSSDSGLPGARCRHHGMYFLLDSTAGAVMYLLCAPLREDGWRPMRDVYTDANENRSRDDFLVVQISHRYPHSVLPFAVPVRFVIATTSARRALAARTAA